MKSVSDEPVPHHFFVNPQEGNPNPWQQFLRMNALWRTATAMAAALLLFMGIAALSRLQIRSDSAGWAMSFGGNIIDVEALKADILETAGERTRQAKTEWFQDVRAEIGKSLADLDDQRQTELVAALDQIESRFNGRLTAAEDRMKDDTQKLAGDIYQTVAGERARDLELIDLRFDSIETSNFLRNQQTHAVLDTLVQVAEISLSETGGK
jgi:hypothetical protein